jgi:hypothetical protein
LALDGVARNVETPEPNPLTPVDTGNPVQLVRVPETGVPRAGAVKVEFPEEYHWVVLEALKNIKPLAGI